LLTLLLFSWGDRLLPSDSEERLKSKLQTLETAQR
jgi:hypothetical protein